VVAKIEYCPAVQIVLEETDDVLDCWSKVLEVAVDVLSLGGESELRMVWPVVWVTPEGDNIHDLAVADWEGEDVAVLAHVHLGVHSIVLAEGSLCFLNRYEAPISIFVSVCRPRSGVVLPDHPSTNTRLDPITTDDRIRRDFCPIMEAKDKLILFLDNRVQVFREVAKILWHKFHHSVKEMSTMHRTRSSLVLQRKQILFLANLLLVVAIIEIKPRSLLLRPGIACVDFFETSVYVWRAGFHGTFSILRKCYTSTNLAEGFGLLIDLDVDVAAEETYGEHEAADTAAYYGDAGTLP